MLSTSYITICQRTRSCLLVGCTVSPRSTVWWVSRYYDYDHCTSSDSVLLIDVCKPQDRSGARTSSHIIFSPGDHSAATTLVKLFDRIGESVPSQICDLSTKAIEVGNPSQYTSFPVWMLSYQCCHWKLPGLFKPILGEWERIYCRTGFDSDRNVSVSFKIIKKLKW